MEATPTVTYMICVELEFTDDPRRIRARPAHRARLDALHRAGRILAAGPFSDDSGALLVFTMSTSEVKTELASDPYYSTPGVEVRQVREWGPVVGP